MIAALLATIPAFSSPPQQPASTIDQSLTAFGFSPDNRIYYSVRRIVKTRQLELQRDDIFFLPSDNKPKRIVDGEKLVRGATASVYSYAVQNIRVSPDGSRLAVEMLYSFFTDERGAKEEGIQTLLLESSGKEIKVSGADSVVPGASQPAWLNDGITLVYLREALQPRLLFSIAFLRPAAGRGGPMHAGRTFSAVAWDPARNAAVGVERAPSLTGPIHLTWLELFRDESREIATLDSFAGHLTISPTGRHVAYFTDNETLEIRDLNNPARFFRLRIPYGSYVWHPDESRILLKPGIDPSPNRSGGLIWVTLPASLAASVYGSPAAPSAATPAKSSAPDSPRQSSDTPPASAPRIDPAITPALHGLTFRTFDISPDGRTLAVTQPGTRHLLLYSLQ